MNLLVTNPQEPQAYTIVRSLRPHARKVVITVGGDSINESGFPGMTTYSRFVDARHEVPHFAGDWLAGRIEEGNTAAEEAYITRIEEICRLEAIDVIFPSLDPEVYVFAKNKTRLNNLGIVVAVPDAAIVRVPLDKGLTTQVAQKVGFPCPRTWFPQSADDIHTIAAESRPPWIIKPRFTAHGVGMARTNDVATLLERFDEMRQSQASVIVQEYIEGEQRQNYYVMIDRSGRVLSLLAPRSARAYSWGGHRVSTKTAISGSSAPCLDELHALLRELGLWGGYTIQTKVDPRDGRPKLMEINARLGQHLWWRTRLGVNEPLALLQIARGETPTGPFAFRDGVVMLDAYKDALKLYALFLEGVFLALDGLISRLRGRPVAPDTRDERFLVELRRYAPDYLNLRPKRFCPEISSLLSDPSPCIRNAWFGFRPPTAAFVQRLSAALARRLRRVTGAA
jgi:predicted ATP-grasp superfamily ATP-dependent carboligase